MFIQKAYYFLLKKQNYNRHLGQNVVVHYGF